MLVPPCLHNAPYLTQGSGHAFASIADGIVQDKVWWETYEAASLNLLTTDSYYRVAVILVLSVTKKVMFVVLSLTTPQPPMEK